MTAFSPVCLPPYLALIIIAINNKYTIMNANNTKMFGHNAPQPKHLYEPNLYPVHTLHNLPSYPS